MSVLTMSVVLTMAILTRCLALVAEQDELLCAAAEGHERRRLGGLGGLVDEYAGEARAREHLVGLRARVRARARVRVRVTRF